VRGSVVFKARIPKDVQMENGCACRAKGGKDSTADQRESVSTIALRRNRSTARTRHISTWICAAPLEAALGAQR